MRIIYHTRVKLRSIRLHRSDLSWAYLAEAIYETTKFVGNGITAAQRFIAASCLVRLPLTFSSSRYLSSRQYCFVGGCSSIPARHSNCHFGFYRNYFKVLPRDFDSLVSAMGSVYGSPKLLTWAAETDHVGMNEYETLLGRKKYEGWVRKPKTKADDSMAKLGPFEGPGCSSTGVSRLLNQKRLRCLDLDISKPDSKYTRVQDQVI
jgi:hypothetical protein